MDHIRTPLTPARIKTQVKTLRRDLEGYGASLSQAQALETLSHMHGYKDWNTFKAVMDTAPARFVPGDRVKGTYLGQAYTGMVHSVELAKPTGFNRIVLEFDKPVDVVTFDSFTSMRRRVKGVINHEGQTIEKTSNGEPHLVVKAA